MKTSLLLCLLALAGCTDSAKTLHFQAMPKELADCATYRVSNADGDRMMVMRCPFSTTSVNYREGKQAVTTIVVDGVEFTPSKK